MLNQFSVENFRSISDRQTLSMVASSDKSHSENLIECERVKLLPSTAIYGANASGKSNLVMALAAMSHIVRTSATQLNLDDEIPDIDPFKLNEKNNEPTFFEIVVLINGTEYQYGFTASRKRIHSEWLHVRPSGKGKRQTRLLLRESIDSDKNQPTIFEIKDTKYNWSLRGNLNNSNTRLVCNQTSENCLFLSRAAQLNVEELHDLFLWFRNSIWTLNLSKQPINLIGITARRANENLKFQNLVKQLVQDADFGISDILIAEEAADSTDQKIPPELKKALETITGEKEFELLGLSIQMMHKNQNNNDLEAFSLNEESQGTQRFFALAGPILDALNDGVLLIVDELDCSLHPLLVEKIVELFNNKSSNKNGAQLIFTTHDSSVMRPAILRRDQIWITEKQSNGATELFSLYDFNNENRPRNNEAFERNYLSGRYGGVPSFGPILENSEIK